MTNVGILNEVLFQTFTVLLIGGCVVSLVIGIALLVKPAAVLKLNQALNKWVSTRMMMRPLSVPRKTERLLYRHHKWAGALLLICAGIIIYSVLFRLEEQAVLTSFAAYPPSIVAWLFDSTLALLLIVSLIAIGLGLFLVIRPSRLKGIEQWANKSYSGRTKTKFLEVMHYRPDRWLAAAPRLMGALILCGSAYTLVQFWLLLN